MIYNLNWRCPIFVGECGEQQAEKIQFDLQEWQCKWPNGEVRLIVQLRGDFAPYVSETTYKDGILTWIPTAIDTRHPGRGKIEIQLVENDAVVKSAIFDIEIAPSLDAPDETPPHPIESWLQQMIEINEETEANSAAAQSAAESAGESQQLATASAVSAAADAKTAQDSAREAKQAAADAISADAIVGYRTLDYYIQYDGLIGEDGTWRNINDSYTHIVVPIKGNDDIIIKAQDDNVAYYTLLTDYVTPVVGETPAYATDYSGVVSVASGTTVTFTAVEDAKYLLLVALRGTGGNKLPQTLVIDGIDYTQTVMENIQRSYDISNIDLSEASGYKNLKAYDEHKGIIGTNGVWTHINYKYTHILIPVQGRVTIKITAPDENVVYYTALADYQEPVDGEAPYFASDYESGVITIARNETRSFTLPVDAKYVYLTALYGTGGYKFPKSFVIDHIDTEKSVADNIRAIYGQGDSGETDDDAIIGYKLLSDYEQNRGVISNVSGQWVQATNAKYTHVIVPVEAGASVRIESQTETQAYYTILSDYTGAVNEETPSYATGYANLITMAANTMQMMVMPNDAKYIYLTALYGTGGSKLPTSLIIDGLDITKSVACNINTLYDTIAANGVNWCAMGDSITLGYVSNPDTSAHVDVANAWAYKLAKKNNWNLTNIAIGGTGYIDNANSDTQNETNAWYVAGHTDFSGFNLVTLAYGINDYKANVPLGTINDSTEGTPTTIIGGMKKTVESILSSNPFVKIVVMTPLNIMGYSSARTGDYSTNYAIGYSFSASGTLKDVRDAIISVCEYYGLEYIDQTFGSVINRQNITSMLDDGVHPNAAAHDLLMHELAAKISFK